MDIFLGLIPISVIALFIVYLYLIRMQMMNIKLPVLLMPTVNIVLLILGTTYLFLGIKYLLSTYWCTEGFSEEDPIGQRIQSLQSLREMITKDLDALDDAADAACDVTKQIEDSYVSNNSAPNDETEYQLPQDVQADRQQKRNTRTKKRFEDEKKRYSVLNNKDPIYECFEGKAEEEAVATEDDLRAEIEDLQRILDTAEAKAAAAKGRQLQSLLGFNAVYLKKGASTVTEGFATGSALLAVADDLITKGKAVHAEIVNITAAVKTQQAVAKGVFQKTQNIQNGQVSDQDAAAAAAKVAPS
jgi:hypothetical protein